MFFSSLSVLSAMVILHAPLPYMASKQAWILSARYFTSPDWEDSVLPANYALSPLRLMLPSFKADGKTDYVLASEEAIAKYGIREGTITYDDIYPSITGMKNSSGQAIDEIKSVSA